MYHWEPVIWTAFLLFPESLFWNASNRLVLSSYQQLHMDPATCLICSSSPLRNPTFTVKSGVFTTVLSDSPRGKCLALPAAARPLFFSTIIFGRQRQKHSIAAHEAKIVKFGPNWEFPYCLVRRVSYFIYSLNHAAFQNLQWILPPEFGLFKFFVCLFHFGIFPKGHFSPLWKLEMCALLVWVNTKAYFGHSQIHPFSQKSTHPTPNPAHTHFPSSSVTPLPTLYTHTRTPYSNPPFSCLLLHLFSRNLLSSL